MTILLRNVSKSYRTRQGLTPILKNINLEVRAGEHVGILGQNGAGKSTLIRVLSGSERPTTGQVMRGMSVSWPLAFGGAFLGGLTGIDNVKFVCRLYGVDPLDKLPFVEDFTELGRYLREPVKTYSSGMRARLAFATSMAVDFDCYLIDEIVAVGDARFQRKCQVELFEKRANRAMILVSHSTDFVRQHCQRASVLSEGKLDHFDDVDEAYRFYSAHELPMQLHMANASSTTQTVHLAADAFEQIEELFAGSPTSDVQLALFDELQLDRVPVNDSCHVVGRLLGSGQITGAEALATYLTIRRPEEPLFWITLADLKCSRRQHRPGVANYRKALQLDPASFWGNRNLATEMFNVGEYALAIPLYEQAIRAASDVSQSLELQLRRLDCYFLTDQAIPERPSSYAPDDGLLAVDHSEIASESGGSVRLSVGGLAGKNVRLEQLSCRFRVGDTVYEGNPSLARNSLRRCASLTEEHAFQFVIYFEPPAGSSNYDVELQNGDKIIHRSAHALRGVGGAQAEPAGDALAAAREADRRQNSQLCALYYGLSDQLGTGSDIIQFAESLIAIGLYDEAEDRLSKWLRSAALHHADRDFALDLLCMEGARSRLPQWREEIGDLLRAESAHRLSASILANEGHALVAEGRLFEAFDRYIGASNAAKGQEMIHFARGIHTAGLALDWKPNTESPTNLEQDGPSADIVHLFACDAAYFRRFGPGLVASSIAKRGGTKLIIHAHIINPDEQSLALAQELKDEFGLIFTTELSPEHIRDERVLRAYFTCARFLIAPALLKEYECAVLITETDSLINWDWDDICTHSAHADVGYMLSSTWNWVPWTKIPAGIILFAQTDVGRQFAGFVAQFLEHALTAQGSRLVDLWTVDQVALWLAHEMQEGDVKRVHLPMSSVLTLATGDKANI